MGYGSSNRWPERVRVHHRETEISTEAAVRVMINGKGKYCFVRLFHKCINWKRLLDAIEAFDSKEVVLSNSIFI